MTPPMIKTSQWNRTVLDVSKDFNSLTLTQLIFITILSVFIDRVICKVDVFGNANSEQIAMKKTENPSQVVLTMIYKVSMPPPPIIQFIETYA